MSSDGPSAHPVPPALTPGAVRVLDAASRLFYERGLHAVGVDAIAEAAGVTKKTLYDRFGSKDAVAVAYLRRRDERWRAHLDEVLAGTPRQGVERVLEVFAAAESWAATNSPRGCSAINARAETGDAGHPVAVEVTRQKAWLYDLLVDLCRDAQLTAPQDLARALMLLYEGALVTLGMATFPRPFATAAASARALCAAATQAPGVTGPSSSRCSSPG